MVFNTTELLKYETFHFQYAFAIIQYSFHGYLSLKTNLKVVKVFNTTELLRYEKAHSLHSLVSAARVYTRSMVINVRIFTATYFHLFE